MADVEEMKESYLNENCVFIKKEFQELNEFEKEDFIFSILDDIFKNSDDKRYDTELLIKRILL